MLNFKLRIPFWKNFFHPIVVTFLGLVQNITSLFKIWLKHRYLTLNDRMVRVKDFIRFLPRVKEMEEQQEASSQSSATSPYHSAIGRSRRFKRLSNYGENADLLKMQQAMQTFNNEGIKSKGSMVFNLSDVKKQSNADSQSDQSISMAPDPTDGKQLRINPNSPARRFGLLQHQGLNRQRTTMIGHQMQQLYQDDYIYDNKLLFQSTNVSLFALTLQNNRKYKLSSLR